MKFRLVEVIVLGAMACSPTSSVGIPEDLTVRQLYASADVFDGRRVIVSGFLSRHRCLVQDQGRWQVWHDFYAPGSPDDPEFDPADFDEDFLTLLSSKQEIVTHTMVRVTGVFQRDYLVDGFIDLGACGRSALRVEAVELLGGNH